MKYLRATLVLAVVLLFVYHVFLSDPRFRTAGVSYWLDPYFINALLEHWYVSVRDGVDPSSPPMYFPARKTLGYSHGLVLYAPFYLPLRLFLHPFQAHNGTVLLAVAIGIISLYVLFRKLGLSLAEALAAAALFFTSRNIINEPTSAWTQRVSVFLIPPILLMLLASSRMPPGRPRIGLAALAGFLATLMYVQDFYTAHFAALFAVTVGIAALLTERGTRPMVDAVRKIWNAQTIVSTVALIVAAVAAVWTWYLLKFGGGELNVFGLELRSHDVRRPAAIGILALAAFLWLNRRFVAIFDMAKPNPWLVSVAGGAAAGAIVFLWIYAGAYLAHRSFPEEHLVSQLLPRYPSRWDGPFDALRDLASYGSLRSFMLVLIVAVAVWVPRVSPGRTARIYSLWLLGISFVVLLIPLRFPEFSVWRAVFEPLPGFGAIRDPKRIVYLYELVVALAAAAFLSGLGSRPLARAGLTLLIVCAIATERRPDSFRYHRTIAVYDRWVAAPISIDPSCRSFYIKGASAAYMSRADHPWSQYSVDAVFVALNHGIPTLNGYSAWYPEGWGLFNPHEPGYDEAVAAWIDQHQLTNVCEFDIDARTMTRRRVSR